MHACRLALQFPLYVEDRRQKRQAAEEAALCAGEEFRWRDGPADSLGNAGRGQPGMPWRIGAPDGDDGAAFNPEVSDGA